MGGYVALCSAMKNPENVNSIITLGTKFEWTEEQALKESKMLNPETILEKVPQYAQLLESQHGSKWKQLLPTITDLMINLGENHLPTINIPTQIMVGDKDNMW